MKHSDAAMFITNMFSQGFSAVWEKNVGVFPTYLYAIDYFRSKTENSLAFSSNTEICSLYCSIGNTLLETKVDIQIRQC